MKTNILIIIAIVICLLTSSSIGVGVYFYTNTIDCNKAISLRKDALKETPKLFSTDWNIDNPKSQEKKCKAAGYCFDSKSGGPWCYY